MQFHRVLKVHLSVISTMIKYRRLSDIVIICNDNAFWVQD